MSSLQHRTNGVILLAIAAVLLPACSVSVKKGENGEDKKVDIRTPVGNINVDNDADVRDTGLPLYPKARPKPKDDDNNSKRANVNLSFGDYGLKVVALEYESDDSQDKLVSFYRDQLRKYGSVLECHVHGHGANADANFDHDSDSKSEALTCEDTGGSTIELKAGTKQNQRIVAVQPQDKGCDFALVRVIMHGKETI